MRVVLAFTLACMAGAAAASSPIAEVICEPTDKMTQKLSRQFGEQLHSWGTRGPEQVMQVWTKPEEDGPPVSLGLLSTGRSSTLTIDGLPTPRPQQLYEITFEPAGGSPTQLPTGPILGKGLAKEPVT